MSENKDFVIENGVLKKYNGPGGEVVIPEGVTEIGWGAFQNCTGLQQVTLPKGLTAIKMRAFAGCTSLTEIDLPDSVSEIVEAVKSALEVTPPELSSDIVDRGITLSGGGSLLPGLDQVLAGEIGIPVKTVENPLDCVVLGAGAMLDRPRLLRQILDSNPRSYD